jgi:hemerythrin superfamily protein
LHLLRRIARKAYVRPGRATSGLQLAKNGENHMPNRKKSATKSGSRSLDAIAMLKADHRQVEQWFGQFSKSRSESKKQRLVNSICQALTVHTTIEEEIFYPAFIEATSDRDTHHEAVVEHAGAKDLIGQIEAMTASDDYFDAKVTVLSEMIKHHVKEEEQRGGMFAEARGSDMDLLKLGQQLLARKKQLMGKSG